MEKFKTLKDHVYEYIADQIRDGSPAAGAESQRKRHLRKSQYQPHSCARSFNSADCRRRFRESCAKRVRH